ncbi:30S ribosomal protein S12 methylthiotransferase RimO [Clostridium aminobutyricum]|uniref:Ribosomal protein uS12 methylthiotransferase RimO n=1 Tax=Clostridium aminobutyricum TaxID=33953 RepID=A0A939IIJ7_CLOAM|nr:30S ribosomal protein S12 methylthiotransferase RimO [Clostridium aminobutyricum]MBN7772559.1 30S ribosomal protein S12 methylthiotransferase RimO [Clostridium aminobutyricum]
MKVYFETLGCPKNANDTEMAQGILEDSGHIVVDNPMEADAIVVNTCGFINDAKKESIDKIFEMADYKETEERKRTLIVSGCLSKRYGEELFEELPEVDIFLGVNEYHKLPEILDNFHAEREMHFYDANKEFVEIKSRRLLDNPYSATIKIAEGCNNVCAYCIIPHIRGHYRSRRMEDILQEAQQLAESGCVELILIAQDVTAYGQDLYGKFALAELVRQLCKIEKLKWIRLMYCYEDRITDELIEVMATESKVCHYIDIPIQHASDAILRGMNRRSTHNSIVSTIGKLRTAMPDIHIRTTLITGFPGEKKQEFDELYDFVEEMRFERLGIFAYSKEEGTPAATMKGQVRADVKEKRKDSIMRLQLEISLVKNQEKIGKTVEVLVEEQDEEGVYIGRTQYDAPEIDNSVVFKTNRVLKPGELVNVKITDAFDYDLVGVEE